MDKFGVDGLFGALAQALDMLAVAKILYSLALILATSVLLWLSVTFGRELKRVWFDTNTYLTTFAYDAAGESRPVRGGQLTQSFRAALKDLEGIFTRSARPDPALPPGAQVLLTDPAAGFTTDASPLTDLKLSWQGVDVSGLLTALRSLAWKPATLTAQVSSGNGTVDANLTWSNAPALPKEYSASRETFFALRDRRDERLAVVELAARVFWRTAAARNEQFGKVDPDVFSEWAVMRTEVLALERKATKTGSQLTGNEIGRLRSIRDDLGRLIDLEPDFAMTPDLRQRAVSLLPAADRNLKLAAKDLPSLARLTGARPSATGVPSKDFGLNSAFKDLTAGIVLSEAGKSAAPLGSQKAMLTPGMALIAGGQSVPFLTSGPIVVLKSGERAVLVPDYAVAAATGEAADGRLTSVPVRLLDGTTIGDLATERTAASRDAKVAFILLHQNVSAENKFERRDGTFLELKAPSAPQLNEEIIKLGAEFFSPRQGTDRGKVSAETAQGVFEISPVISRAGDGGAPLVRADGTLVGIVYSSNAKDGASLSPSLFETFERLSLNLYR